MKSAANFRSSLVTSSACLVLLGLMACRDRDKKIDDARQAPVPRLIAPELRSNGLGTLPGAVHSSQAKSAINWQPWSAETMARAKDANRLIFAVIAMPQFPGYQSVLSNLSQNPALVSKINDTYVPVLVDGDASREVGLFTADLCAEINRGLQLPLFLWLTAEGHPVAWLPAPSDSQEGIAELFSQSASMVEQMWVDDAAYVLKNSVIDNTSRRERIAERRNVAVKSDQPAEDVLRAIRQLVSFYDPYSRTFDEAGGLFPSGSLDLISTASIQPGLNKELRAKCLKMTQDLLEDLLGSAMFDPLEGGLFTSRGSNSWTLPNFTRDSVSQARAAVALINAHRATGNPWALEKALELINFSEKAFITQSGLFALGTNTDAKAINWLWSLEEIEKELSPEDAAWWISITGMKALGNLPSEADEQREFFRYNSLAFPKSIADLAASAPGSQATFSQRLESVRAKLIQLRRSKLGEIKKDQTAHAGANFRMVSAYASAFAATGDEAFREKASALLEKSRSAFSQGPRLKNFTTDAPASINDARAFLYGLALQASLDVATITHQDSWMVWAEDLATTAAELFTDSEFLKECPESARILDLPITDLVMLFDDSTAGLISMAECRLAESKRPLVPDFSKLATPLPTYSVERPILHTDLLQATLARHYKTTVIFGTDLSPELKTAIQRLPLRMIQRRAPIASDEIPAGSVKVIAANAESRLVKSPEELQQAILPSP